MTVDGEGAMATTVDLVAMSVELWGLWVCVCNKVFCSTRCASLGAERVD